MADSRRQTRSTQRRGQQTEAQFWSNQPDPLLIERGQADAIRLVRSTVNPASGATTANELMEANATNTSGVPPMVFVDDEGLEEQFLTEDEDTPNVLDTTANLVTTPVEAVTRLLNKGEKKSLIYNPPGDPEKGAWSTPSTSSWTKITRMYFAHLTSKQTSAFLPVTEI